MSAHAYLSACLFANRRPSLEEDSDQHSDDFVEKGLISTASMFAKIPASGAAIEGYGHGNKGHDFVPMASHVDRSAVSANGIATGLRKAGSSENMGGMRGAITSKLAQTLSYTGTVKSTVSKGCGSACTSLGICAWRVGLLHHVQSTECL